MKDEIVINRMATRLCGLEGVSLKGRAQDAARLLLARRALLALLGPVKSSSARDTDWIARNLGDVPYRHTGGLWELVAAVGIDGPLPVRVPPSEPHAWLCDVTLRD